MAGGKREGARIWLPTINYADLITKAKLISSVCKLFFRSLLTRSELVSVAKPIFLHACCTQTHTSIRRWNCKTRTRAANSFQISIIVLSANRIRQLQNPCHVKRTSRATKFPLYSGLRNLHYIPIYKIFTDSVELACRGKMHVVWLAKLLRPKVLTTQIVWWDTSGDIHWTNSVDSAVFEHRRHIFVDVVGVFVRGGCKIPD